MNKNFRLLLTGVKCISETFSEWGDDEIMIVGFAMTDHGERIFIKPHFLGGFTSGEVGYHTPEHPLTLADLDVKESTNLIAVCIWMVEMDGGDVYESGTALQNAFNKSFDSLVATNSELGMHDRELAFYSFAQTMTFIRNNMRIAASDFFNDDDILGHLFQTLKADKPMPWEGPLNFNIVPYVVDGATYSLSFEYKLSPAPLVTL